METKLDDWLVLIKPTDLVKFLKRYFQVTLLSAISLVGNVQLRGQVVIKLLLAMTCDGKG